MSFETKNRPHITADNIREALANGGYRCETADGSTALAKHEALLFAIEDAAEHDHIDLIKELIAGGADVSTVADPLIVASEMGHLHIVRFLIDAGANVNGRGRQGETSLVAAASCGHAEIVKCLLNHGADPTMQDMEDDSKDALGWAQMGFAEPNWPEGMPDDIRTGFDEVIAILTGLCPHQ